jgi:hypothetical protein
MRVFAYIALLLVINPLQEGGDSAKVIGNDFSRPVASSVHMCSRTMACGRIRRLCVAADPYGLYLHH